MEKSLVGGNAPTVRSLAKIYVWCQKHLGEMIRIKVNLNKEVNKDD